MSNFTLLNGVVINTKDHMIMIDDALDFMYGLDRKVKYNDLTYDEIQRAIDYWCMKG